MAAAILADARLERKPGAVSPHKAIAAMPVV